MKITKYIIRLGIMAGTVISLPSCTDLSETVYDQVMSQNYYNTKQDVINAVFRPFEHIYESIVRRHEHEELTGDQLITPTRGTWWYDGGKWIRTHKRERCCSRHGSLLHFRGFFMENLWCIKSEGG